MTQIVIQHSSNLRRQLNLPRFVEAIRLAALASGIFPLGGMRTQAYESKGDGVADHHFDHTFVHLCVHIGQGRDHAARRQVCEEIFAAAYEQLREVYARAPLGISVETQERDPDPALRQSNIHDYARSRGRR